MISAPAGYTVRTMSRADLERTLDWAAAEGWNPGLHDATPFHLTDPRGFLVGLLDDEPVASISVVRYPGGIGFLGLYIVTPDLRGLGFGRHLWRVGLAYLEGCTVGLDGVVEQQANYRRSWFAHAGSSYRFGGVLEGRDDPGLLDARSLPFDRLLDLDEAMFFAPRPAFLSAWLAMPESTSLALVEDGALKGMATLRRCRRGHKVGPLYAPDRASAERLLLALAARIPGQELFLDVPGPNDEGIAMAEALGLTVCFETARMYKGPPPELPLSRTYGLTTFELG